MEKIDKLDRQILNIISKNARIPFKDVAEECGVSRAAMYLYRCKTGTRFDVQRRGSRIREDTGSG